MKRIWKEINLSNLQYNLSMVKDFAKNKSIICMVKDNAYGHDAKEVSLFLEKDERVAAFAVASAEEAMSLVGIGIKKDIIIISHICEEDYETAIKNDIIITISTVDQALKINEKAKKLNQIARVQIAIDTGMNRIGFKPSDEAVKDIINISKLPSIKIHGVYSHFAVADSDVGNTEDDEYTNLQETSFDKVINALSKNGINNIDTSISNSAGILSGKGLKYTSVRPGIILYGILPSERFNNVKLKPVLVLKSRIVHLHKITKGTSVSYGRTFISDKDMLIATISCGYGDGYPRSASNRTQVIVNDRRCSIIGRISMDAMMVDVSNVDCKINDEVILIGKSETEEITLKELCDRTGEFTYEILTRINTRAKSIFKYN